MLFKIICFNGIKSGLFKWIFDVCVLQDNADVKGSGTRFNKTFFQLTYVDIKLKAFILFPNSLRLISLLDFTKKRLDPIWAWRNDAQYLGYIKIYSHHLCHSLLPNFVANKFFKWPLNITHIICVLCIRKVNMKSIHASNILIKKNLPTLRFKNN